MSSDGNKKITIFKEYIIPVVVAIVVSFLMTKFLFYSVSIPSESMVPTINKGDRLLATRIYNKEKLQRGDIVIFYSDELDERLIKRLIGLPGDKIEIKDGIVFVNNEKIKEDYVVNKDEYNGVYSVPEGEYFFLGDNRPISKDSRRWKYNYISSNKIEGKAQFRVFPLKDFGSLK